MTFGWVEDAGRARYVALAGGSCNAPILGFAAPRGSSTRSLTSNGSWVHALQCLWVALHACIHICRRHIYQSSRSVCETWWKPLVTDSRFLV